MFARKLVTGGIAGAMTLSVIALTAGTASAAYTADPDDVAAASAADLVGVGSDTSQVVIKNVANAYNLTNPAVRIATYAATGGGTIAPPGGAEINRPNGSGAGKTTLYNPSNAGVDFARSSSAQNTAETGAQLQSIPFALDTLATVTSKASNAPATIDATTLVNIYKGNVTNWSQVPGSVDAGVIKPYIPQAGSGTRSFFEAQLAAANGGSAVTLAGSVATFQENDDALIKGDANAIAPFSSGRAALLGTLRVEGGFKADRALYNVFRGASLNAAGVQDFFGEAGFLCSQDATKLIEDAGFKQLASSAAGGACGTTTQIATTNFATSASSAGLSTATSLSGTSPSAGVARLVAGVTSSTSPQGTVSFFEGTTQLATKVPLVSGQATFVVNGATPGAHTYTARFVPAGGSVFRRSTATTTVAVSSAPAAKVGSTLSETFPSKAKTVTKKGKPVAKAVKGTVKVSSNPAATGTVVVKKGSKTLGTATVSGGVATFSIKKGLKPGTNKLTATYAGDAKVNGSSLSFTVKVAKAKKKK